MANSSFIQPVSESDTSKGVSRRDDSLRNYNFSPSSSKKTSSDKEIKTIEVGLVRKEGGGETIIRPEETSDINRRGKRVSQSRFKIDDTTVFSEGGKKKVIIKDIEGRAKIGSRFSPFFAQPSIPIQDSQTQTSRLMSPYEFGSGNLESDLLTGGVFFNPFVRTEKLKKEKTRSVSGVGPIPSGRLTEQRELLSNIDIAREEREELLNRPMSGGEIQPLSRREKFRERFIGRPGQAFFSPFVESAQFFSTGGKETSRQTSQFLASGTPLESTAALAGSVLQFASAGRGTGIGKAEAALFSGAPKGLRFAGGLAVGGLETAGITKATQKQLSKSAPAEFQPFLTSDFNQVFRTAREAEQSAESSFIRRNIGGLNANLNQRNIDVFKEQARESLKAQGLKGKDLDTAVEALTFRRTNIGPAAELAGTLNAGRIAEIYGRVNVGRAVTKKPEILTQGFGGRGLSIGRRIAPAGFIETFSETQGTRSTQGTDLPVFDGPKSLLPEVSFKDGFSVRSRSQLGQDVGLGLFGAGVSGLLGGVVGAGGTAPKGVKGTAARQTGRTANIIGNIADVSEPVTDLLAGNAGFGGRGVKVVTFSEGAKSISTGKQGVGLSESFGFSTAPNKPVVPPTFSVPSNIPIISPSIAPRTPVSPISRTPVTPSPVQPTPVQPTPVSPISRTPVTPQPIVPVPITPLALTSNVPVTSFVGRVPPPVPIDINFGRGLGVGVKRRTTFVNELEAAFGSGKQIIGFGPTKQFKPKVNGVQKKKGSNNPFFGELDAAFSAGKQVLGTGPERKTKDKSRKKSKSSSNNKIFGPQFNIFGGGRFV